MSIETANEFVNKLLENKSLMEQVMAVCTEDENASIEAGLKIAESKGYKFSKDDWKECLKQIGERASASAELTDDNLDKVVGGTGNYGQGPKPTGGGYSNPKYRR